MIDDGRLEFDSSGGPRARVKTGVVSLPPMKILVVDDSPEILTATARILESAGYEVFEAAGAIPGLSLARSEKPDIILLDVVLPDGDGRAVCAEIKRDPALADCFVILTSNMRTGSSDQCEGLEGGADGYIARPIPNRELVARVDAYARIRRTEKVLWETELKFHPVFATSVDAIGVSKDGIHVYVNPAFVRMLGYEDPAELIGSSILGMIAPEMKPLVAEYVASRSRGEGAPICYECVCLRKDGIRIDTEIKVSTYSFQKEIYTCVSIRDISAKNEADMHLQEARDFYLNILEDAPALIWRAGKDGRCDWFNATWLEFRGRSLEEESGEGWTEGVHPDDLARCVGTYLEAFGARKPFEMEYRLRSRAGDYIWLLDIGRPFSDLSGNFSGYIGYCFDVTKRKETESALESRIDELRRWHAITLGREERILQLKAEVNSLLAASGREARYESATQAGQS